MSIKLNNTITFFLVFTCFSCHHAIIHNDKMYPSIVSKIAFRIELNSAWDDIFGLPIQHNKLRHLDFCLFNNKDTSIYIDNGYISFSLNQDTLVFKYSDKSALFIDGKFLVPPTPKVIYKTLFDPMTFDAIITPLYYYEPVRYGKWIMKNEAGQQTKVYGVSFLPPRNKCE